MKVSILIVLVTLLIDSVQSESCESNNKAKIEEQQYKSDDFYSVEEWHNCRGRQSYFVCQQLPQYFGVACHITHLNMKYFEENSNMCTGFKKFLFDGQSLKVKKNVNFEGHFANCYWNEKIINIARTSQGYYENIFIPHYINCISKQTDFQLPHIQYEPEELADETKSP